MKKQYDFSKGERGKFYRENARLNKPIYLDPQLDKIVRELAEKKNTDAQTLVNEWVKDGLKRVGV